MPGRKPEGRRSDGGAHLNLKRSRAFGHTAQAGYHFFSLPVLTSDGSDGLRESPFPGAKGVAGKLDLANAGCDAWMGGHEAKTAHA